MPFVLPTFNIVCNIWNVQTDFSVGGVVGLPTQANVPCGLQFGKKTAQGLAEEMWLLLPLLTNVNGYTSYLVAGSGQLCGDAVEVPAGSGRFYTVVTVDDVAKGYPTEYRVASIQKGGFMGVVSGAYLDPIPWP